MPKDFRRFMQDLYLKVGALPIVVQSYLRAPKWLSTGDRLKAKQDIPVRVFYDWRHASGDFRLTIPAGTVVEYRGPSPYSDFVVVFPEEVMRTDGAKLFAGHEWLLEHPEAYTLEVSSKFPQLILEKA